MEGVTRESDPPLFHSIRDNDIDAFQEQLTTEVLNKSYQVRSSPHRDSPHTLTYRSQDYWGVCNQHVHDSTCFDF